MSTRHVMLATLLALVLLPMATIVFAGEKTPEFGSLVIFDSKSAIPDLSAEKMAGKGAKEK